MFKNRAKRSTLGWLWFSCGALSGITALSLSSASLPPTGHVTDDTAIYQNLSEIRSPKAKDPNFDADIERLANLEKTHQESAQDLKKLKLKRATKKKDQIRSRQSSARSKRHFEVAQLSNPMKRIEATPYVPSNRAHRRR